METISRRETESRGEYSNKRGGSSNSVGARETIMGYNHRAGTPIIRIPTAMKERGQSQCGEDLDAVVEKSVNANQSKKVESCSHTS